MVQQDGHPGARSWWAERGEASRLAGDCQAVDLALEGVSGQLRVPLGGAAWGQRRWQDRGGGLGAAPRGERQQQQHPLPSTILPLKAWSEAPGPHPFLRDLLGVGG